MRNQGRLRGRSVMAYRDSQSFRDNYALQREVGYGILEADLTDDTVVAVGFDYQNKHVQGTSWGTLPYWNSDGGKARLSRSANMAADWSSWPLKDQTTFASVDHKLSADWRLKAAYTHRQSDTDGKVYYGGAGFPNADGSGMTAWTNQMVGTSKMDVVDFNLAGAYSLLEPDIADRLRERKLDALMRNSPDRILSANIGCETHLSGGVRVPVEHWIVAVARGL